MLDSCTVYLCFFFLVKAHKLAVLCFHISSLVPTHTRHQITTYLFCELLTHGNFYLHDSTYPSSDSNVNPQKFARITFPFWQKWASSYKLRSKLIFYSSPSLSFFFLPNFEPCCLLTVYALLNYQTNQPGKPTFKLSSHKKFGSYSVVTLHLYPVHLKKLLKQSS
jgi:hypothetical protein